MRKSLFTIPNLARWLALLLMVTIFGLSVEVLYANPTPAAPVSSPSPTVHDAMPDDEAPPSNALSAPEVSEAMPEDEVSSEPENNETLEPEATSEGADAHPEGALPEEAIAPDSYEGTTGSSDSAPETGAESSGDTEISADAVPEGTATSETTSSQNASAPEAKAGVPKSGISASQAHGTTDELVYEDYTNPATNYGVLVYDEAELLNATEKQQLIAAMKPITAYENAYIFTLTEVETDVEKVALKLGREFFDKQPGTIFVIDMEHRRLRLLTLGSTQSIISDSKAKSIVANVYSLASDGDYYGCFKETMQQVLTLLQGGQIQEPMKHVSNALLALCTAFLLGFFIINFTAPAKAVTSEELLEGLELHSTFTNKQEELVRTESRYDPPSSSDSSSGGGGGGGSCSDSGSGASHSF